MDNTAISNFSVTGCMDILRDRYGGQLMVTREVLLEAEKGIEPDAIRQAIDEGWIELRTMYADSQEHGLFVELRDKGFGLGEASAIAVCSVEQMWAFVSDDLDARREARQRRIEVVGTYGILARHVAERKISLEEGNELLRRMIDAGFRSHSDDLQVEVERLKSR